MKRTIRFCPCAIFHFTLAIALVVSATRGDEPNSNPPFRSIDAHKNSVLTVKFTADGKSLVSGSRDNTIKIWDVATLALQKTLTDHKSHVYCVEFSHDAKLMASGSLDNTIILWDAKTYTPIRTLTGHKAAIRDVAFSPDDKTLASVGEDGTFRLWNVETGELKTTRAEHTGKVKSVEYMPDGKTIVTASSDATIRMWDATSGGPQRTIKAPAGLEFCSISPDGKQMFSGTGNVGQVTFWDPATGEMLKDFPKAHGIKKGEAEVDSGEYSPDGKFAVSGSKDRTDKFWDPKTFEVRHIITGNPGRTESMCFSPDGKLFVVGMGGTDYSIRIYDVSAWMKE